MDETLHAQSNQYYLERQNDTESNARTYPRNFPYQLKKPKAHGLKT